MSLEKGREWSHQETKVVGLSLGGVRTCLTLPEHKIGFDIGIPLPFAFGMKSFFITHGHMDHAGGIPYFISQRNLMKAPQPVFYMPSALLEPLQEIMNQWEKIEDHHYSYSFIGVGADSVIELNPHWKVESFQTLHRVPSFGYTLIEVRKRLKGELAHAEREQLLSMKEKGLDIHEHFSVPTFSFTGDTQIEFLDLAPQVKKSKILFMEVTFWDGVKPVAHAREWGHTHFDEVLARLPELECEKIVFLHPSARYSAQTLRQIIKDRVPRQYQDRIDLF